MVVHSSTTKILYSIKLEVCHTLRHWMPNTSTIQVINRYTMKNRHVLLLSLNKQNNATPKQMSSLTVLMVKYFNIAYFALSNVAPVQGLGGGHNSPLFSGFAIIIEPLLNLGSATGPLK